MSDSIKVAIKVRPLIKREKDENLQVQWTVVKNVIVPTDPEKKRGENGFQFDHIFDSDKTNDHVFETVVKPIVDAAVRGFNGTVFAYGQTSSGKTHTMLGTSSEPGIIPMAIDHMFDSIADTDGREFLLRVSYLEIYNEKVNDLLATDRVDLKLREDNNGLVQVLNCKEDIANSPEIIMSIMKKGDKNRRIGETDMNDRSSRSHTIFRITIESRDQGSDSDGAIQVAQLNLVDLAGSERARQTNATGERFKEGTHINMSLSTLGLVIKQLSESSDTTKYINFRDSKLTRLLQASLGGNAMTVIICAVTPAAFEETQCTLSFACRAKSVKNKPQLNEVVSDAALLKRCKKQIAKLHAELEKAKNENRIADVEEMESKLQEKEHKLRETDRINQLLEERIHLLENNIISTNATRDCSNKKFIRSKRRRTWAGDRALHARFSLGSETLPTIKENPSISPDSKSIGIEKNKNITRRKSIIQTVDLHNESFETAFADFELDMIKVIKEREEETDNTLHFVETNQFRKEKLKNHNRVKFQDDIEIHRFSSGSNFSDALTPEKQKFIINQVELSSSISKPVLKEMLNYITQEYYALQEYTILERQVLFVEQKNFESSDEKIFMQKQIYELLERVRIYNINQTELDEKLRISLNCINHLMLKTPDILNLWKQSLSIEDKDEINMSDKLKELEELLENLKNEKNDEERSLTSLEKQLTNDYNVCLQNLDELKIQNEKTVVENTKLKKELLDESNKLKNANTLMNTLRTDTDYLMTKLLQKDSELSKLKEKVVELERANVDSEKAIANDFEISTKQDCDVDLTTKLNLLSGVNQDKNNEILKLNEIIQTKSAEIIKYKQFEEKLKVENESLKQALNDALKVEQISKEFQIDTILDHENEIKKEKNMMNEINQQKNDDVSKLSKLIQEQSITIQNYEHNIEEMKKKIEDLQMCLDTNKVERISQECQTENLLHHENENSLLFDQPKNIEISNLLKKIEECNIEIEKYKELQNEKKDKIEEVKDFNISVSNEKLFKTKRCNSENDLKEDEILSFHSPQKIEISNDFIIENKISKLESIINEKSLQIEHLQLCLSNENKEIDKTSKECQTDDNFVNKTFEISRINSINVEMYESNEDIKLELEQSEEGLQNISKSEKISELYQTEFSTEICDKNYENTDYKIERHKIVEKSFLELENYKKLEEEMNNKIKLLQQKLDDIKTVEQRTVDCQTEYFLNINEQNQIDFNPRQMEDLTGLLKMVEVKELEISEFKQREEEKAKEIERLQHCLNSITNIQRVSKDCQTECNTDTEYVEIIVDKEEGNETSKIIEDISCDTTVCKQLEEQSTKMIDCSDKSLDSVTNLQNISVECQTEYISDFTRHIKININEEKENEILKLSKIIEEKSFEISVHKQLKKEMTKEIECLKQYSQNLMKLEYVSTEVQTEELLKYDNEKIINQLETPNQIVHYQEEIETLLTANAEFQEKITLLNNKLTVKIEDVEKLNNLVNLLKNEIIKKTNTMSNLMQDVEIKIQKLGEKLDITVLEKNVLKAKIDSVYSTGLIENVEKDDNPEIIIKKLKLENDALKKKIQVIKTEYNDEANLSTGNYNNLVLKSPLKSKLIISADNFAIKPIVQPMNNEHLVSILEENITLDSDKFLKPDITLINEQKDSLKLNASATTNIDRSCIKPLIKKCELESSSIFANMTYFDEMEISQSFNQDCTTFIAIDETKDISNISTNIHSQMINHVTTDEFASNTIVPFENSKNVSKMDNVLVTSPTKLNNKTLSVEEFEKIKTTLEQENVKLNNDLQNKIQEIEEFQRCVSDVNQTLRGLQETVFKLTTENVELSKQLCNITEKKDEFVKSLQIQIDTLTDRLSSVTEEKVSLKNELEVLNEQFDNMRALTPVITDENLKNKISEDHKKIHRLTNENIALSTNLIEKIDELDKIKESKTHMYDHQCSFKDKHEKLLEHLELLEKENIELSNNVTEHIEECEKLKDAADILKVQLEAYQYKKNPENSSDNVELLTEENARLKCELIELRAQLNRLTKENTNLSINEELNDIDEENESPTINIIADITSTKLEGSVLEDITNEFNNISVHKQNKHLRKEVENLILHNKKLSDLKLANCSQCAHLKEINECRRNLKLQIQFLNQKLADLEKKFKKKCSDTEILKAKLNENHNTSLNLMETTLNGSYCDGMNLTSIEERVRNLQNELEESKENQNMISNSFKEKYNEVEKLQLDNNSFVSPIKKKEAKRLDSSTPSKNLRMHTLKENLDNLSKDLKELKKSNDNNTNTLTKLKQEQSNYRQEIESLKLSNEELKKECDIEKSNALNFKEKINLLEEELETLYKRIETANFTEKQIEAQKLEIELKLESLLKEKEELMSTLNATEEKFKKQLEDCNVLLNKHDKENINLKNELKKIEDIKKHKEKDNYSEQKLAEEIESAKSRITTEIKSLTKISENERRQLSNKSVTDIFLSFLTAIVLKEKEIVKKLEDDSEKAKRKLEEEKQQSIDSEKRTKIWAQTLETDFEKLQLDFTKQEHKNKCLEEQVKMLEKNLNEAYHENQQFQNKVRNLEMDINSLHNELEKNSKLSDHRDAVISVVEEKERMARSVEEEWENRLKYEKEEYERKLNELNTQLGSYKSINEDLKSTIEGFDVQIEHLKNTINIKANESATYMREVQTLMQDIDHLKEINEQLKIENSEKNKNIEQITDLLKIKCDLLTEYKTKVETMKPEYESLQSLIAEREIAIEKRKEEIYCLKMENKKQIDILQDKLSAEEIKSEGLNNQLRGLKNKNTTLHGTLEEYKDRCQELQRDNENLQRKVRNSTSKLRFENEVKELQDENRSLKNHLEGSYNRIKELQESKSQVQMELTEAQGKNSLVEQELNTTKMSLESLREKYNNMNLQKLREKYELLLREKSNIILEIEEKKMLIANKDQKLVECNIEIDTLRKQKEVLDKKMENMKVEKSLLENRISDLESDSNKLKQQIDDCNIQKDEIYKVNLEEKNQISIQLENCQKEISNIQIKNKELNDEMDELVEHIHKQENEIADLQDRLITGSSNKQNVEKLKILEEDNEKLKIDLRVTEINYQKLQNEVVRLNTEKELLVSRIEDLNSKITELKAKNNSRSRSHSNSPTSQKGRRRNRRSDLFNQNRNIEFDGDNKEISDTESPSITPTPIINCINEECPTCSELRNRIREMSLDHVTINNKITMLEMQLQAKEFPYQMKCNELQENLLTVKTRNSELKFEIKKLKRALMEDCSRDCHMCRYRKHNKRDQSVQVSSEPRIHMTGMSSGIVEDHLKLQKMEKERNLMKEICRNRARKIKDLEQYIKELESSKTC